MMHAPHTPAFDGRAHTDYTLIEILSDQVDEEMLIASESSGIPDALEGLWWMDGNPLPDEVISFGASRWNSDERATRIVVYGERIWSWHGNLAGRLLYRRTRRVRLVYEFRFDPDMTHGTIVPIITFLGIRVRIPGALTRLTMERVRDGLWLRKSLFFGLIPHIYHLRRIVSGAGSRLDTYAAYVKAAPPRSFLAIRRDTRDGRKGKEATTPSLARER